MKPLFTFLFLLLSLYSFATNPITLAEIHGKWIYLTTIDGERVRFQPCDADNKGFEIRTEKSTTYLHMLGGLDVSTYLISSAINKDGKLLISSRMEGSNDSKNFEFWWVDKFKGIGHLEMKSEYQEEMYEFEYVQSRYENNYPAIKQPCVECEGIDCEDLMVKGKEILDKMKKITGSWVSVDDPSYTMKFVNIPNFATGTKYDYYQKKEQGRFNYSFYNGRLSIYEPANGIGETHSIIELTDSSLVLSGPTGKELKFKRPNQPTNNLPARIASFLRTYLKDDLPVMDADSRKYAYATADINQDGRKELFVALINSYFCGSGGCTMLILTPEFKLISKMTVVNFPLYITKDVTNGWDDLIINSRGYHLIKHNGKNYPSNPSVQPETKLEKHSSKIEIFKDAYSNKLSF